MERLVFVSGPMEGQVVEINCPEVTIGREPNNRLQLLGDRCVSRRHAQVTRQGDHFVIEDLGSRNGTMVNGHRIQGPVVLNPGDQVQMAFHVMRVEWSPAAFGPSHENTHPNDIDPQPVATSADPGFDKTWLFGLIPFLVLAPVIVVTQGLSGLQLVPLTVLLTGIVLALVGVIKLFRRNGVVNAVERAFVQTISGSVLAIVGALWLQRMR